MGNLGSISGLARSLGEGKGYPLQYSGLENSMDCIDHGVTKIYSIDLSILMPYIHCVDYSSFVFSFKIKSISSRTLFFSRLFWLFWVFCISMCHFLVNFWKNNCKNFDRDCVESVCQWGNLYFFMILLCPYQNFSTVDTEKFLTTGKIRRKISQKPTNKSWVLCRLLILNTPIPLIGLNKPRWFQDTKENLPG